MIRRLDCDRDAALASVALALLAFLVLAWLVPGAPARAQDLPPEVLERIQQRTGVSASANANEQVDRSRERAVIQTPSQALTPEELDLRRERSRQLLTEIAEPSVIERQYRRRLEDFDLTQFGYSLFRSTDTTLGQLTGAVGDDYILGVGDEVIVTFTGATNDTQTGRIARDGRLIVSPLPPVQAAGRSLGSLRAQLAAATRSSLLGTDVFVARGGERSITVFIGGEVERPGQYQVTALSDVATVLAQAGGVRKTGTLRNIRVSRGGVTRTVDLYGLLGIGTPSSVSVQDGDRIVVPVIGDTAAITGQVARPGIYELRGETSIGELMSYAGGAIVPRGYEIALSRIEPDGTETFVRIDSLEAPAIAGDAIQILSGSTGGSTNRVVLNGFVANPGPRSLAAAPTVGDLVGTLDELRLGTYLPMAALIRRDMSTGMRVLEAVDLRSATNGSEPVPLQGGDRLYIFSSDDIQFLNRAVVREVLAGGPANQCRSLQRLEALVNDTQSPRFNAVLRNSFFVEENGRRSLAATGEVLGENVQASDVTSELGTAGAARMRAGAVPIPQQQRAQNQQQEPLRGNSLERRLYEQEAAARWDQSDVLCPQVFENEPDLLPFLLEQSIGVGGAVRRPGGYPVADAGSADLMIAAADGMLATVDTATLDVTRDGVLDRFALPGEGAAGLQNVVLQPGDELRVTASLRAGAGGAVLLSGEFRSPGLYSIRPGERLSELLERAGGYTPYAYPYGAVFTRRSVREAQQEAAERVARQLNESVLALAARGDVNGEGVIAAAEIIDGLASDSAPGRMVVEANPAVLEMRPDLDPILQSGDSIYVPAGPTSVYVFGDVLNPGAIQFQAGQDVEDYIAQAGGSQANADEGRAFLVLPNGIAQPLGGSFWRRTNAVVPPGSTIVVPKDLTPLLGLEIAGQVAGIFGGVAQSIAAIAILADRN